jgi:hypothetical protein
VRRVAFLSCFVGLVLGPPGQQPNRSELSGIRAKVRVTQETYCRADADLFTVSLKLDVEVLNSSTEVAYLPPKLIPWVARVAANAQDAKSGHFLYEISAGHYPQDSTPGAHMRIGPGKTTILHMGYDLVAKYDPAFSYPKTLHAGSYAVVFVLRPGTTQPSASATAQVVESLTTDPFIVRVPQRPKVIDCEDRRAGFHPTRELDNVHEHERETATRMHR